jgi:hypothetical protein
VVSFVQSESRLTPLPRKRAAGTLATSGLPCCSPPRLFKRDFIGYPQVSLSRVKTRPLLVTFIWCWGRAVAAVLGGVAEGLTLVAAAAASARAEAVADRRDPWLEQLLTLQQMSFLLEMASA